MADEGRSRQEIWASEASLTLLGSLRLVRKTGDEWTPKPRKTRALLAIVALAKGSVTRSRLTDLLWGDRGEDQAKASLRQALYELRDLSSSGLLTVSRDTVAIGPKRLWTDVNAIETATEPSVLADALDEAEWPPLGGLDDVTPELDEWLRNERVRLSALVLQKGVESAENAMLIGKPMLARRIADSLERIDPLDERAAQAGARADIALGDRAAAHRRIERLKTRLRDELGLEPSAETQALLAESPASGAKPSTAAPAAPTPSAPPRRQWLLPVALMALLIVSAAALYILRPGAAAAHPNVAILPFEESGPKTPGYFATGVSDEILNLLSREKQIQVLGRVSAEEIAGRSNSLEIARKLGITHLLDGSVRTAENRVLLIVTLTRVSDGAQMWSERYERRLGDIFAVQGEVARTVASRLARSFGKPATQATSPEVYDRYLAARQLVRERREVPLKEADRLLREAIALDPRYAPAYAELSQVQMLLSDHPTNYGSRPLKEARAEAGELARKAIQLDPNLGDAYAAMGLLNIYDESALPYYRKAVELSPQRSDYHRWLGQSLWISNRFDEGLREYRRATELDPLWGLNYDHLTGALQFIGRTEEANRLLRRFLALSRDDRGKLQLLRSFANAENRLADNLRYSRILQDRFGDERLMRFYLANAYGWLGERREAARFATFDPMAVAILSGNATEVATEASALGTDYWDRANFWSSARYLLATGQAKSLARIYDRSKPAIRSRELDVDTVAIPELILALREVGRASEADTLLAIYRANASKLPPDGVGGAIRKVNEANVAALSGHSDDAVRLIDGISRRNALSLNVIPTMSLLRNPVLAGVKADPRLAVADERLRAAVNNERHKAGLASISREAWIGGQEHF
ncbi:MAG TPA: BTAD domain-containing putative transcriptional regulator [Sphingomicrobium sp.]|nr:BTAD domain-containing putative transcriptional regulator [Sphingomicrobium sp.]